MRKHPGSCYPIADTAKLLKQWLDLQLSGHTHGGQFMIPGVGPCGGFTKRSAAACQIGTALGAIHAKRLCQSGAALGMGAGFPSGRNEPAVY